MQANILLCVVAVVHFFLEPILLCQALIPPNEQNIEQLLKVTGGHSKMHTGEGLIIKAKRDPTMLFTRNQISVLVSPW